MNKKGFTLMEVVVSVALVTIVAISFFQVVTTSVKTAQRRDIYDKGTVAFLEMANGMNPDTTKYKEEDNGTVNINIGGTSKITLNKKRASYKVADSPTDNNEKYKKRAGALYYFTD